jgi:hypothetical protein
MSSTKLHFFLRNGVGVSDKIIKNKFDIISFLCDSISMIEIEMNEIDDETFSLYVEMDDLTIEVEGNVWTDEIDNLWGDQVSSVSTMAYFDSITNMRVYDEDGDNEHPAISLKLYELIKSELNKRIDEEIDNESCRVDYSCIY